MDFYIDSAVACGWLMNFICTDTAANIMKINISKKKLALFSFFLSILGVCCIFSLILKIIYIFIYGIILSILFGKCSFFEFTRRYMICIGTSLLIGAVFLTLMPHQRLSEILTNGGSFYVADDLYFYSILIGVRLLVKVIVFFLAEKKKIFPVSIKIQGNKIKTTAMVDTGNSLRMPGSGEPVIIAERSMFNNLTVPERIIRCKTVCGEDKFINVLPVDDLYLHDENKHIKNIYASLTDTPLSKKGSYQILLHNSII